MTCGKYPTAIRGASIHKLGDPQFSAARQKSMVSKRSSDCLLPRRDLLLFEVLESLAILTELFRQGPLRPQQKVQVRCPRLRICFRVLDGDIVQQVVVIDPPEALYDVQSVAVRVTYPVKPGFIVEIYCVDDQRISLPVPDRVSHPRRAEAGVMRAAVRVNLTPQRVVLEEHNELAGCLNNLQGERMNINSRQPGRKTSMVNGIVCFRERMRVSAERRPGSFVLRLAPGCHGRLFDVELINPIYQPSGRRAVFHPDSRKIRCLSRMRSLRRFGWLFVLSRHSWATNECNSQRKGNAQRMISHYRTPPAFLSPR